MPAHALAPRGPTATTAPFGQLPTGEPIAGFTLTNAHGLVVHAIEYGGAITRVVVPDRDGTLADVVLGCDTLEDYIAGDAYLGAIIGRVANRIGGARFTLDGMTYTLAANTGPNALHGGGRGFDKLHWRGVCDADSEAARVTFRLESPDGDEGYPGALTVTVTYTLTNANALVIDYEAATTRPTPVNLTNHAYFNLAGHDAGDIDAHVLAIDADAYTPLDASMIPTGEIAPVAGTPFDFRVPTRISARIDDSHEQLRIGHGYDHNWEITGADGTLRHAARVHEPSSGRTLDVHTTEPGLQCFTVNFLSGSIRGKSGVAYQRRAGFSLETQRFPDAPNRAEFPSVILRPGAVLRSRTVYTFGVDR